jgi:hypothetical protein
VALDSVILFAVRCDGGEEVGGVVDLELHASRCLVVDVDAASRDRRRLRMERMAKTGGFGFPGSFVFVFLPAIVRARSTLGGFFGVDCGICPGSQVSQTVGRVLVVCLFAAWPR